MLQSVCVSKRTMPSMALKDCEPGQIVVDLEGLCRMLYMTGVGQTPSNAAPARLRLHKMYHMAHSLSPVWDAQTFDAIPPKMSQNIQLAIELNKTHDSQGMSIWKSAATSRTSRMVGINTVMLLQRIFR